MSHDRFCPATACQCDDITCDYCGGCRCDLITRVRDDEQSLHRISKACRDIADKAFRGGYQQGYLDALNIRPPLHPCVESPVWAGQPNSQTQSETRS